MVDIPAVCNTCGSLFFAPNLVGGNGQVKFINSKMGPCPSCGGVGDIFDGVYSAATNTAKLIISSASKAHQLKTLKTIFLTAKKNKQSAEQINFRVQKEVPELQSIADWLPKTRMELYTFIGIVLALITYISTISFDTKEISEEKIKGIVENSIQQELKTLKPNPIIKKKKIGRNQPCICGSGKKYKRCCLTLI